MFLLNGKHLPEGVSFYDANGTQYPPQWLNVSSAAHESMTSVVRSEAQLQINLHKLKSTSKEKL